MVEKKSIKKNFVWQVGIEVTNMLLPLITSPILSRRMGSEALGIYSYVYTITYYFFYFALLGMIQYGTREIAFVRDDKRKLNKRFSELIYFQLLHGFMIVIIFFVYTFSFSKYPKLMMIQTIYLLGAAVFQINYLFYGLEEFKILSIKTMLIRASGVVFIFLLVHTKEDLPLYTLIMALEPLVDAIVLFLIACRKIRFVKVSFRDIFKHTKGIYLIFLPIMATFLFDTMDKLMLGNMNNMSQLGFYSNAEKTLIARKLAVALSAVVVPRMSKLVKDADDTKFQELLDKSIEVILILSIAFGFGTAAVSSVFSVVFWGKDFIECSKLIQIMSFTIPAYGLTYVINNQYLVPLKNEKIYIRATLCGAIINFILNWVMIPFYGAFGAAIATLITQFVVLIYECVAIRNNYLILIELKKCIPYLFFAIAMYVIVKIIDGLIIYNVVTLLFEVMVGGFVFSGLCLTYWLLTNNDIYLNIIKKIMCRRVLISKN